MSAPDEAPGPSSPSNEESEESEEEVSTFYCSITRGVLTVTREPHVTYIMKV